MNLEGRIARLEKRHSAPKLASAGTSIGTPADFAVLVSNGAWKRAPHLALLEEALIGLSERRIRRLLVQMPPRHGKTELTSRAFPAWYLAAHPTHRVILASYGANFAKTHGRRAREYLEEFGGMFGVHVKQRASAAFDWELDTGGGMITAGIRGPITGRGADLLIIDDPVKNDQEAESETTRERNWDWFQATARTRLEPGGVIVVIQTRWHESDLAGRLLAEEGHEWTVLSLPALSEGDDDLLGRPCGTALWPQRFDEEALADIRFGRVDPQTGERRGGLSDYFWAALYQQRPGPREGNLFKRQWFRVVEAAPAAASYVRFWDLAATDASRGGDPDWTAGVKMCIEDGIVYVTDITRLRGTPLEVRRLLRQTAELDGRDVAVYIEEEPGASGKSYTDNLRREVFPGFIFSVLTASERGSKLSLASPFSAQAEAGNVLLVKGPWVEGLLREAESFPHGSHDDQIDAASSAYYVLTGSAWKQRQQRLRVSTGTQQYYERRMPPCPNCGQLVYLPLDAESALCTRCGHTYYAKGGAQNGG
jgi:predicted phage terminase large subunit-like protein